jgi:hypothetical protein
VPLERDYVLLYGPKEIVEDGVVIRNKILRPCGCWEAEVWREVAAPDGVTAIDLEGRAEPVRREWAYQTGQCHIHAAKVAVLQWQLAVRLAQQGQLLEGQKGDAPPKRINAEAYLAKLGDSARRLYADTDRVLAEAAALDRELAALGAVIPRKRLEDKK